jgi:hypothetical protein
MAKSGAGVAALGGSGISLRFIRAAADQFVPGSNSFSGAKLPPSHPGWNHEGVDAALRPAVAKSGSGGSTDRGAPGMTSRRGLILLRFIRATRLTPWWARSARPTSYKLRHRRVTPRVWIGLTSPQLHRNRVVESGAQVGESGGGVGIQFIRDCRGGVLAVLLSSAFCTAAAEPAAVPPGEAWPFARGATDDYQRKLAQYTAARQAYEEAANLYWDAIADKRRARIAKRRNNEEIVLDDYVLTQPPVYSGPPRPADLSAAPDASPPVRNKGATMPTRRKYVPVAADFLRSAAEHFAFVPRRPGSEIEFKRAYAETAAAAGLTRDQVVHIYSFETGGNGRYDAQAGLEYNRPGARAIHTALGYNQVVGASSIGLLAEKGDRFIASLEAKAAASSGDLQQALHGKIAVLQRMVAFTRTVPDQWREHLKLAETPQGLAIHALLLDLDVGPLLQAQKLSDSVEYARRNGCVRPLTATELGMMNLTGDGNGLDMVMMPAAMRETVPTANFFVRAGYERNPVASRYNVVAKLFAATAARMDAGISLPGARELADAFESVIRDESP